ncbi:cation efflux family protein [Alcanivorax hongdengensis A-11-3]|uniref:Cation-efflux pump FieF n=1 Tax=Alcanivorax hongdengensis A-11-3 TaxID=1177179 RepID=L0WG50_9GAMM|nr:cation diffusion facilitator family transporter [Alcanivorax hongdengensis]EKF75132.1 cation efflux family protein [Alcanivorax hongdengensis A-11-3]
MTADVKRDHRLLITAGLASVLTAIILIAAKAVAWMMTGSVSLLASLVDSVMDSIASLINFVAIRYSLVPADEEHRFGHGKAEALAGLGQAVFIFASSVFLLVQAVQKLMEPVPLKATTVGVAVMVFSIVMTLLLLMIQKYVVRQTGSTAIEADSLHYLSDLSVNVGIILVLVLSPLGFDWLDGLVALGIALYILRSAWQIGFESAQLLLDREIPGDVREVVGAIVAEHELALGFHDLRTRQSGRTQFIQLHVDMDQNLSLLQAHGLAESIEMRIREQFPAADVIIHQDPVAVGPHVSVDERLI